MELLVTAPLPVAVLRQIPPSFARGNWAPERLPPSDAPREVVLSMPLLPSLLSWEEHLVAPRQETPLRLPARREVSSMAFSAVVRFLPNQVIIGCVISDYDLGKSKNGGAGSAQGTSTKSASAEAGVKAAAGTGATSGLPTCSDNGTISVTYHQVYSISIHGNLRIV